MQSWLIVPAAALDVIEPAVLDQADVLTVAFSQDGEALEQSRRNASAFLVRARIGHDRLRLFVQINDLSTGLSDADLDAVLGAAPDGVVLPGCTSGEDVQHLGTKLAVREAELGLVDGATAIIAITASHPAALFQMETYAGSSPRLAGLAWDMERLARAFGVELGGSSQELPAPLQLGRTLTIVAARAAGVPAIDTACALEGEALAAVSSLARRDGFTAKFAVAATQLPIIRGAFKASDSPPAR